MKKLITAVGVITCLGLTGCTVGQSVPKLKLSVNMKTGEVTLNNPKDTTIKNYRTEIGTNGAVIVTFDSLTTVMNPDVITTTGDAQAKMIGAVGTAILQATQGVGAAAGAAGAAGLKP